MFQPNCRAIFSLIFEMVECTIDNALKWWSVPLTMLSIYEISYYKNSLK